MTARTLFVSAAALCLVLLAPGCDKKDAPPAKPTGEAEKVAPKQEGKKPAAPPTVAKRTAPKAAEPGAKAAPEKAAPKDPAETAAAKQPAPKPTAEPIEPPGADQLSVVDLKLAAGVEQRMPWGIGTTFPTGARKVLAWTRVKNKGAKTFVDIVWFKGAKASEKEVHRAKLTVGKSVGWRTWSKKRLAKGDEGPWRVAVVAPDGNELQSLAFTVVAGEVVEPTAEGETGGEPKAKGGDEKTAKKPARCRALVVAGGPKGVVTADVRIGADGVKARSRRGVTVYQGKKAYAVRVVNIHKEQGDTVLDWQELWALELPDGKPSKLWGEPKSRKLRIDASGPAGVRVRQVAADGKKTMQHLAVGTFTGGGKPGALRPKPDADGWVSLGEGCGHVKASEKGLEVKAAGAKESTTAELVIGGASAILGVTALPARARFDLRWMFNQKVHAATLLKKGRRLSSGGNYGFALATLAEALLFKPADSTIAGEMSWAALRKGDMMKARRWATQARQWSRNDRQRAIALYNLGRIAESQDRSTDALAHYKASMKLRPNTTVAARIKKLEPPKP